MTTDARRAELDRCATCGDLATQWDYDQLETFCDRHVQQADFTVPLDSPEAKAIRAAEARGIAKGQVKAWASAKRLAASLRLLTEGQWRKLDALFDAEIRAAGGSVSEVVAARLSQSNTKGGG